MSLPCLSGLSLQSKPVAASFGMGDDYQSLLDREYAEDMAANRADDDYLDGLLAGPSEPGPSLPAGFDPAVIMDGFNDAQLSVERATEASEMFNEAVADASTLAQAADAQERAAERAEQAYEESMREDLQQDPPMTGTEEWARNMELMRAEQMRQIAEIMHAGGGLGTDKDGRPYPTTTDKKEEKKLMNALTRAYKKLENSATSQAQVYADRQAYEKAQRLVQMNFEQRRKFARGDNKNQVRRALKKFVERKAFYSPEKRRQRVLQAQNKARLKKQEQRRLADIAAVEKAKAEEAAQEALKKKKDACRKALGALHEWRQTISELGKEMLSEMKTIKDNCMEEEGVDNLEPWMREMLVKAVELQDWVKEREEEDPEGWDLNGHMAWQAADEDDDDDDSDSDSGSDSGSDSDMDEEDLSLDDLLKHETKHYEGFMTVDDDYRAHEASIQLQLPLDEAPTINQARKPGEAVHREFLLLLREIEREIGYTIPDANVLVDFWKPGVLNLTVLITEEMWEHDKPELDDEGNDIPKPADFVSLRYKLEKAMMQAWSARTWSEKIGYHVLDIMLPQEGDYPWYSPEEEKVLDQLNPDWFMKPYVERRMLQGMARLMHEKRSASKALADFKPTAQEIDQVWRSFGERRGWPRDWLTNENFAKSVGMDDVEKLRLLFGIRHGFDEERNAGEEDV